ncbi:hypothetical protein I79_015218 [Cricetulus griseus]|uniref:Uncharacterized protein n=1 Tax=Cricetulus griseus TaxID=10029 RepID=G3HW68_CRIGR|nr:hypothetical protein I79_015218 [Cricetulus griseus]
MEPDRRQGKCMEGSGGGPDVFRHLHPPVAGNGSQQGSSGSGTGASGTRTPLLTSAPGEKQTPSAQESCSPILSLWVLAPETARPPGDRVPAQRHPRSSPAEAGEGGDPGLVGKLLGREPPDPGPFLASGPRRAEDGCPGARRTVTCHTGRAAPGLPSHPRPQTRPCGQRPQGDPCHCGTRGQTQKPGCRGRLLSPLLDPGPRAGFRCESRRKSAGDPHPVGPLGMRSAPALVRRSPGFRRSSERRRGGGAGRTRRPGAPRLRETSGASELPGAACFLGNRRTPDFGGRWECKD